MSVDLPCLLAEYCDHDCDRELTDFENIKQGDVNDTKSR